MPMRFIPPLIGACIAVVTWGIGPIRPTETDQRTQLAAKEGRASAAVPASFYKTDRLYEGAAKRELPRLGSVAEQTRGQLASAEPSMLDHASRLLELLEVNGADRDRSRLLLFAWASVGPGRVFTHSEGGIAGIESRELPGWTQVFLRRRARCG